MLNSPYSVLWPDIPHDFLALCDTESQKSKFSVIWKKLESVKINDFAEGWDFNTVRNIWGLPSLDVRAGLDILRKKYKIPEEHLLVKTSPAPAAGELFAVPQIYLSRYAMCRIFGNPADLDLSQIFIALYFAAPDNGPENLTDLTWQYVRGNALKKQLQSAESALLRAYKACINRQANSGSTDIFVMNNILEPTFRFVRDNGDNPIWTGFRTQYDDFARDNIPHDAPLRPNGHLSAHVMFLVSYLINEFVARTADAKNYVEFNQIAKDFGADAADLWRRLKCKIPALKTAQLFQRAHYSDAPKNLADIAECYEYLKIITPGKLETLNDRKSEEARRNRLTNPNEIREAEKYISDCNRHLYGFDYQGFVDLSSNRICAPGHSMVGAFFVMPYDAKREYPAGRFLPVKKDTNRKTGGNAFYYQWDGEFISVNKLIDKPELNEHRNISLKSANFEYSRFLYEFDHVPLEEQRAVALRLASDGIAQSVTFSGNKSYHIIIEINDAPTNKMEYKFVHSLIAETYGIYNYDPSTAHNGAKSRRPNMVRYDTGKVQELIHNTNAVIKLKWRHLYTEQVREATFIRNACGGDIDRFINNYAKLHKLDLRLPKGSGWFIGCKLIGAAHTAGFDDNTIQKWFYNSLPPERYKSIMPRVVGLLR
ncbi:MAG: hypothetical protein LBR41_03430 [Rickettsiales bacterium]|jgi:hypothetical protein|nr:hypothetical protein [Rickettsiales bacterium]